MAAVSDELQALKPAAFWDNSVDWAGTPNLALSILLTASITLPFNQHEFSVAVVQIESGDPDCRVGVSIGGVACTAAIALRQQ